MASHEKSNPVKGLQDVAAAKTVELLVKCDNPTTEFLKLDEHVQRLIFSHFLSTYALLEKQNEQLRSDEDKTNGFVLNAKFVYQWRHATAAERNDSPEERRKHGLCPVDFEPSEFYSHGDGGELVICNSSYVAETENWGKRTPLGYGSFEHKPLSSRISSQLLYYRVAAMFGMPPPQLMLYAGRFCWQATPQHKDGKSLLELKDSEGQVFEWFSGTKEAKKDALDLLSS
ncbi:hypothetical protein G647_00465 [Cladophialophora carrionii CBS 160.54]|uniref:Uncharacterized protein n=1 Tax=Cladophialophora carrionii CBS 160.54 TaxID=1279043 RepID=V9DMZ0_9EURO|nr:uncharacterized protein G647_00465 [Cladophialophora carrionii CBS 160.54]ETI28016.1 hypothetical protein G647_00465 [Cladophialophora carrionii CBS 160.54]